MPETLKGLLKEVGRGSVPALLANAKALQTGEPEGETEIDGAHWVQQTLLYHGKCLLWINEYSQILSEGNKQKVDGLLNARIAKH